MGINIGKWFGVAAKVVIAAPAGPAAVLAAVAPNIGAALSTPLAKMALGFVSDRLGLPRDTTASVLAQKMSEDPALMAQVRAADQAFAEHMDANGVDLARIAAGDRADARQMQIQTHSKVPAILAIMITATWIAHLFVAIFFAAQVAEVPADVMSRMLATLDAALMLALMFFLGSSIGSRQAQQTIETIAKSP